MPDDSDRSSSGLVLAALVVAVLVLVALVIVIPNFLRSRMVPGESSSVGSLRTINTAEVTYAALYPKIGFSPALAALGGSGDECTSPSAQHACLVDNILASGLKSGYRYRYAAVMKDGVTVAYTVHADPVPQTASWLERLLHAQPEVSQRHLFSDESGVIRSELSREAGPQSPPL